ncbi:hypothetical protein DIZ81_13260 [Legionella taurinensis]|uniref:Uncharacterized protein n=1 Tax=Legionella taurinensis TaxID=70611 RepID=A0AB38N0X9_9GAMM|nr:hypothetical protein [Legionella taurinensis]MDX1836034.1 hypothetical protein [Legionella taurinensis]PUT38739.1 hypothetical protein DB744_13270 [Legionella taurinensis]PUT40118.1 hypothetical protein DB746_12670 [Legionella taurinensis]PUT42270.1 hypothetical protein DB743_13155 [Legionella taurinensis]PUT46042.1 hypothetical protein DB745_12125 [Legionella taurinensis]
MTRPVALLDVDDTVLIEQELNTALLESLKNNGVKDIYLFTDMTFKTSSIEERLKLKERLEGQGFRVHGFITPLDLTWTNLDSKETREIEGQQANDFMTTLSSPKFATKKLSGDDFDSILADDEIRKKFSSYKDSLERPLDQMTMGGAFEEAKTVYESDIQEGRQAGSGFHLSHNMNFRGDVAKLLGDQRALHSGYSHSKGLMLEAFMMNKPGWVSSIIIADDHPKVIESCEKYKSEKNPAVPITTIHVDKKNMDAKQYDDEIKTHLQKDPSSKVIKQIDEEIARLEKSKRNFFLSSPKSKIVALEKLKEEILNADLDKTSIHDVIHTWENSLRFRNTKTKKEVSVSEVLSQHRNFFKAEFSSESTSTQKFISSLKEEYNKIKQGPQEGTEEIEQTKYKS